MLSFIALLLWRRDKSRRFLLFWGASLLFQGIALLGLPITSRDGFPLLPIPIFTALIIARILSTAGILVLFGKAQPAKFTGAAFAVWLAILTCLSISGYVPEKLLAGYYFASALLALYAVHFLLTRARSNEVRLNNALPLIFAVEVIVGIAITAGVVFYNDRPRIDSVIVSFALISGFVLFSAKIFMAVWLTVEKFDFALKKMAYRDPLTNVLNRRGMMVEVAKLAKTPDAGPKMACFILDLDNFKGTNDAFGHSAGDHALKRFANIASENLRNNDVFARSGGEEFAIFARLKNVQAAKHIAERIRLSLEQSVYTENGKPLKMTVSIGISLREKNLGDVDAMLREADRALYQAKEGGRNQVVVYQEPHPLSDAGKSYPDRTQIPA